MFAFIEASEFRESLEADYAEMHRCADAKAWKSAHVLAGSIVEALLIDYLLATTGTRTNAKDPLRMDLAEAITLCKAEGLLNERTADLSTVVRSYRNLIHPGRVMRLKDEAPNENSSVIAIKLVDMITAQVEQSRKQAFGLTAEQLLAKIERDDDALSILKHLLADVNASQRGRFLLQLLPPRYREVMALEEIEDPFSEASAKTERLKKSYRLVLEAVDDATKRLAASRFVSVLREEDGESIRVWREAFFRPRDLPMVSENHRVLVKEHLLASPGGAHLPSSAQYMVELSPFLSPDDVRVWIDPYLTSLLSASLGEQAKAAIRKALMSAVPNLRGKAEVALDERVEAWLGHAVNRKQETNVTLLRQLQEEIEDARLPF